MKKKEKKAETAQIFRYSPQIYILFNQIYNGKYYKI